jgi:threonine dehydratase
MEDIKQYPITLAEVIKARKSVYDKLKPTPLIKYNGLSEIIGAQVFVKHENHNPTGSLKIRGGVNLISHLKTKAIEGVITFSTGNHGISTASAAKLKEKLKDKKVVLQFSGCNASPAEITKAYQNPYFIKGYKA